MSEFTHDPSYLHDVDTIAPPQVGSRHMLQAASRPLHRRAAYSLMEVLLAMVILVVVVVAAIALFKSGQDANATSVNQSSVSDAGDQLVRALTSHIKSNWELTTALPGSRPEDDETHLRFEAVDSGGTFRDIDGVHVMYHDTDNDGQFDFDADGGDVDGSGFFKMVHTTDANLEDFSAIVRVWHTTAYYCTFAAATGDFATRPVPASTGITLNVELSYPADVPYSKRTKRQFSLNIFRPLENPATGYLFPGALSQVNINRPPTQTIEGTININPNNSGPGGNPEFVLTKVGGTTITRDDLLAHGKGGVNAEYTGQAISVWIRPKGNGNQNGLTLNGNYFELENAHGYHISGQNMTVNRYYDGKGNGKAMGKWYIDIVAYNAVIAEVF